MISGIGTLRAQLLAPLAMLVLLSLNTSIASAQATITPNYKDADIQQIIEAVSAVTGKNFVLDPRVKAQVTMLSSSPMSPDGSLSFYFAGLRICRHTLRRYHQNIARCQRPPNARMGRSRRWPRR